MKKVVIAVVLLVSSLSFAQEVKPKLEVETEDEFVYD